MKTSIFCNFYMVPESKYSLEKEIAQWGFFRYEEGEADPTSVRVIVNKSREVSEALLDRFVNVRWIVIFSDEDWMVSGDLNKRGVRLMPLGVDRGFEVAEHAIALMLLALKKLSRINGLRSSINKKTIRALFAPRKATEEVGYPRWKPVELGCVYGRVVGILGYGLIGREIHKRIIGFKPGRVHYTNTSPYSASVEKRIEASYLPTDQLFEECDIVFVQLPYNDTTVLTVDHRHLSHTNRQNRIIVNCGRAGVIDKAAICQALKEGALAFYAADVYWQEPIPIFDLLRWNPRCFFTPHIAESIPDGGSIRRMWMTRLKEAIPQLAADLH